MNPQYIIGTIDTAVGKIPRVSSVWSRNDVWSTIKVRWNLGRMNYRVEPGLYAIGQPDENAAVYVTANFKLSFDDVRRALHDLNAWVLVLDTKGINVWCAAGKGTFGTEELCNRIRISQLHQIVNHRRIIVPQLGATGVAAHLVKNETGFQVVYGPVRAEDIKDFIASEYRATAEMRKMIFPLQERIKLIPVELSFGQYYLVLVPALIFVLAGLNSNGFSVDLAWVNGGRAILNLLIAYVAGCVLTPVLLPWIPFRRFALKGLLLSWISASVLLYFGFLGSNVFEMISWFMIMGGISSFLAMNFTGASTFTSLSGVQKEMKTALPLQIGFASVGFIGWMITRFI